VVELDRHRPTRDAYITGSNPVLTTKVKDMKCKTCFELMNPKRLELGYRTCINCSDEPKWSSVPVINHKTGNEIQIVKDPEVAAEFMAKSARKGFGTLKGMSSSYKRKVTTTPRIQKPIPEKVICDKILSRRPMPNDFEAVGTEVMSILETQSIEQAYFHIEKALAEKRIFGVHAEQLRNIIQVLTPNC